MSKFSVGIQFRNDKKSTREVILKCITSVIANQNFTLSLSRSLSLHHLCSWCNRKPLKATKFKIKFKQFMHYPSIYKHHPAHCNSTCNQARTVTTVGQVLCTENIQGNCWNDVEHITFTNLIKYGMNWIPKQMYSSNYKSIFMF